MWKVLIGVLSLIFVLAMIPVTVIALTAPPSPPPMASMAGPMSRVDFSDLPPPEHFSARDRTRLQYYAYPAGSDKIAVLVHGTAGPGTGMHALAKALRDAGVSAYALDIRGHGGSGRRGDIDYIGQIDDDLADFVTNLGPAKSGEVRTLIGFLVGLALRFVLPAGLMAKYSIITYSFRRSYRVHRPCVRTLVAGRAFQIRASSRLVRSMT